MKKTEIASAELEMVSDQPVLKVKPMEAHRPARSIHWLFKLVLLATTVLFSVGICELATRLFAPQIPSWLAIYRHHPELPFYGFQPHARQTVDSGETYWTAATDEFGDRVAATDGANRPLAGGGEPARPWTLCLGDSFLFAYGVDYEQSFVGRLEGDHVANSSYVNAGVPGYGPVQYRHVLDYRTGLGQRPDRVLVVTFLGNDFQDCVWSKDIPVTDGILGKRSSKKDQLKEASHLYRLISRVYHQLGTHDASDPSHAQIEHLAAWDDEFLVTAEEVFRDEFQRIAQRCQEIDAELLVVILPSRVEAKMITAATGGEDVPMGETRRRCRTIFDDLGIRFVDPTDVLCAEPFEKVFFLFDGHLTPYGHEIVYNQLVKSLTDLQPSGNH